MQIETLITVRAVSVAHEEVALGHLSQVVLMKKLAVLALLAQAAQPVLADQGVQPTSRLRDLCVRDVSFRASCTVRAMPCLEGFAYRSVGGEADLVGSAEEVGEAEVVGDRGVIEDCARGGLCGCCHGERDRARKAGEGLAWSLGLANWESWRWRRAECALLQW